MAGRTELRDLTGGGRTPAAVLALTRHFLAELHAGAAWIRPVTLDSALEHDLGLDSLSRVKFAARIERAFAATLPEQALGGAVTLRDLVEALQGAPQLLEARVAGLRLIGGSLLPQMRRMATAGARLLYGLYRWLLFALIAPPTWLLTGLAPSPAAAWRANRRAARTVLRLAGMGPAVRGAEHLLRTPCVLVANHASYLDGMALFAALPAHFSFVAKREFLDHPLSRAYLRGLGLQFVERFAARQSVEDARRLAAPLKAGTSVALFPEDTFRRMPGLASFHLG